MQIILQETLLYQEAGLGDVCEKKQQQKTLQIFGQIWQGNAKKERKQRSDKKTEINADNP